MAIRLFTANDLPWLKDKLEQRISERETLRKRIRSLHSIITALLSSSNSQHYRQAMAILGFTGLHINKMDDYRSILIGDKTALVTAHWNTTNRINNIQSAISMIEASAAPSTAP